MYDQQNGDSSAGFEFFFKCSRWLSEWVVSGWGGASMQPPFSVSVSACTFSFCPLYVFTFGKVDGAVLRGAR